MSDVHQIPRKKEVLRVLTTFGHAFDFELPEDFSMGVLMTSIKASGHMMNTKFFVPYQFIASLFVYEIDKPPQGTDNVIQFKQVLE